jgi:hypothetical protein
MNGDFWHIVEKNCYMSLFKIKIMYFQRKYVIILKYDVEVKIH